MTPRCYDCRRASAPASIGTATTSPYAVQWNTTTVANGMVALKAVATDMNGNVGTSPVVTGTVTN